MEDMRYRYVHIHRSFCRGIYGILFAEALWTTTFAHLALIKTEIVNLYVKRKGHVTVNVSCAILLCIFPLMVLLRRHYPVNCMLLVSWTLARALCAFSLIMVYNMRWLLLNCILTLCGTLALIAYMELRKGVLESRSAITVCTTAIIVTASLAQWVYNFSYWNCLFGIISSSFFHWFAIYEVNEVLMQRYLGEEIIAAAIELYFDSMRIFLFLFLRVAERIRRKIRRRRGSEHSLGVRVRR